MNQYTRQAARNDDACVKWNDRVLFRVTVHQNNKTAFAWSVYSASRTEQALKTGLAPSASSAWGAAREHIASIVGSLFDAIQDGAELGPDVSIKVPQ